MDNKKYHIITYGCQMNVHESEKLAGMLIENGFGATDLKEDADLIILNTCCIRETAETHVLGNLGIIKKLKEKRPSLVVAVCGCMTQQNGAAEKLKKRCPFINIIFGTHNLHKFGEYLKNLEFKKSQIEIWEKEQTISEDVPVFRSSGLNAWVNIMYGCNNFCSYCIVPHVRGRERSRDASLVLSDVQKLLSSGYKEITLLGQNVNSYGNDFNDPKINFAYLLEKIAQTEGKFRLKFMTSHPKDLSEEVVKVIARYPNISKFIHLPVQSGSDRVLDMMNRKYSAENYLDKIAMIRKYIPDAGLSTDMMVGFPSETDEEFLDSLNLLKTVKFNNVFTFIYSRRSGTKADIMENQIDIKIKKSRIKQLIDAQFLIGKQLSRECVGKVYEVLCDKYENGKSSGKTDCGKTVVFDSDRDLCGEFVQVKIKSSRNTNLSGEVYGV